jgi:hypothetical protein
MKIELNLCNVAMEILAERAKKLQITTEQYVNAIIFDALKEKETPSGQ